MTFEKQTKTQGDFKKVEVIVGNERKKGSTSSMWSQDEKFLDQFDKPLQGVGDGYGDAVKQETSNML